MSAAIIAFPARAVRSQSSCAVRYSISTDALAEKFTDHYLPVVRASIGLLEADDFEFEGRCRGMLDTEGTKLIEEMCAEMEIVSRQMRVLADGLDLTRARLRTAMGRLSTAENIQAEYQYREGARLPEAVP